LTPAFRLTRAIQGRISAHVMKGNPEAEPGTKARSGTAQEPAAGRKAQGFFDTAQRPFEGHMREGAQEVLKLARPRRCSCGASMSPYSVRRYYVWYLLPSGHELYYRCPSCGKAIKISSLLDLVQAMLLMPASGLAIFFIARWAPGHDLDDFGVGGVLGTALLLVMFAFSVYHVYSGLRIRHAHPVVLKDGAH